MSDLLRKPVLNGDQTSFVDTALFKKSSDPPFISGIGNPINRKLQWNCVCGRLGWIVMGCKHPVRFNYLYLAIIMGATHCPDRITHLCPAVVFNCGKRPLNLIRIRTPFFNGSAGNLIVGHRFRVNTCRKQNEKCSLSFHDSNNADHAWLKAVACIRLVVCSTMLCLSIYTPALAARCRVFGQSGNRHARSSPTTPNPKC